MVIKEKTSMPYVTLGNSGLKISKIILGCMSYGSSKWMPWILDEEEAIKHIKYAYDQGIQTFDTADVYSNGWSEIVLGKAIKQLNIPREEIVVMTKVFGVVSSDPGDLGTAVMQAGPDKLGYVNQHGLSRKHIFDAVKNSLKRLQLDYIDLLQCHRLDGFTPFEETMQALHDVVKAGYVRYIGMSSCYAYQFHVMQNYAINNHLTPFISMQNQYSLIYREEEKEMMPTLKHFKVGAIPWSPLARGALSRPPATGGGTAGKTLREDTDEMTPEAYLALGAGNRDVASRVAEVAKKRGVSMAQVALAWVIAKDVVTAPIIGTTSITKIQDSIDALKLSLTEEEIKYMEEPYVPWAKDPFF